MAYIEIDKVIRLDNKTFKLNDLVEIKCSDRIGNICFNKEIIKGRISEIQDDSVVIDASSKYYSSKEVINIDYILNMDMLVE